MASDDDVGLSNVSTGRQGRASTHVENGRVRVMVTAAGESSRMKWSPAETEELLKLVDVYGKGKWSVMLANSKIMYSNGRTSMDLKDKYRNISKRSSYQITNRRKWMEVLDGDAVRQDSLGSTVFILKRFPREAACYFLRFYSKHPDSVQTISVREDGRSTTFMYTVDCKNGRWMLSPNCRQ